VSELLVARGVRVEFEKIVAVRDLDLKLSGGQLVGLVGPNGAGKTTLLRALAGIYAPDRGYVRVRGKVACLRGLTIGFNGNLTGRENVFINGSILGLRRREIKQRLDAIVEFSELGDFIDAPVRTYSSGMKSRLGFAIAVNIDPDVLLLDEALSAGDAAFKAKAGSLFERLRSDNKTVVIASHNMSMVRTRCTRAVWLENGRIRMEGEPDAVAAAYSGGDACKGATAADTDEDG
jgi:teichoic acid transport system ATP-binding protein